MKIDFEKMGGLVPSGFCCVERGGLEPKNIFKLKRNDHILKIALTDLFFLYTMNKNRT